jgi:hypothetical protein
MKLKSVTVAVAAAVVMLGVAATSMAQAAPPASKGGAVTYKMAQTVNWTETVCGVTYTGWIHEIQQYTLTPTGQLNFHYIANGEARGADGNHLKLNNKELDHILQTTVPNLAPYGGSLQGWVADNMDVIVEINAQYNQRTVKPGSGGKTLQNHWVFQVNHNGTTVDSVKFTGGCS